MTGSIDLFGNDIPEEVEDVIVKRKKVPLFGKGSFLEDINTGKKNILRMYPETEKDLQPFILNRAFSMDKFTVMFANEMNAKPHISKRMLYDFYIYGLPKARRHAPWAKKINEDDILAVMEYYQYSEQRALEVMPLLSSDDIEKIKIKIDKGGK